MDTLVLNFFAGPGCGKSTMSSGVFSWLKSQGVLAELVQEFAKDMVWSRRFDEMANQLFIFGMQHHRIWPLLGQVEVIVVDGPLLHSLIYDQSESPTFSQLVREEHRKLRNLNIFLQRVKPFRQEGRVHDEEQSRELDQRIRALLDGFDSYLTFPGDTEYVPKIGAAAMRAIGKKPE